MKLLTLSLVTSCRQIRVPTDYITLSYAWIMSRDPKFKENNPEKYEELLQTAELKYGIDREFIVSGGQVDCLY